MFTSFADVIYYTTWITAKCDDSLLEYYRWFFWKNKGIKLMRPKYGAHISIVRGHADGITQPIWKRNTNGIKIEFNYSNELIVVDNYVWMPVWGDKLNEIRENVGMSREPVLPFHMTIGRTI